VLDVALRNVSFRYDRGFALEDISLTFSRSTNTAIVGPSGCGASTLLRLIAGTLRPCSGDVVIGQRRVNGMGPRQRPLLSIGSSPPVPGRWSVQHALVAAVRGRALDRHDRYRELGLAAEAWELAPLMERRVETLSSTESVRLSCARIELQRPGILVADRLLEKAGIAATAELADRLARTLRVIGATVISVPASPRELAFTDSVVVLDRVLDRDFDRGRIVQRGTASQIHARPVNEAAATATGDSDVVPITITGNRVESVIGSWEVDPPPFQGSGVALVRPTDFIPTAPGEDSDLIFGVEEAGFAEGRWIASGLLSGGISLRVELPGDAAVHKGRLLALRYDPSRFRLIPREAAPLRASVPTDLVPPMKDTR
jgi:ABC-type sugar transport system ATPase subunit